MEQCLKDGQKFSVKIALSVLEVNSNENVVMRNNPHFITEIASWLILIIDYHTNCDS